MSRVENANQVETHHYPKSKFKPTVGNGMEYVCTQVQDMATFVTRPIVPVPPDPSASLGHALSPHSTKRV